MPFLSLFLSTLLPPRSCCWTILNRNNRSSVRPRIFSVCWVSIHNEMQNTLIWWRLKSKLNGSVTCRTKTWSVCVFVKVSVEQDCLRNHRNASTHLRREKCRWRYPSRLVNPYSCSGSTIVLFYGDVSQLSEWINILFILPRQSDYVPIK